MVIEDLTEIFRKIDDSRSEMITFLGDIIREPAIGPESGGGGELGKAGIIEKHLHKFGIGEVRRYDAPDPDVSSGIRPNIEVVLKGKSPGPRIVVISHMDVVAPGSRDDWVTEPFEIIVKDGKAYGRGVEDNGQSITASIYAAKVLRDLNIQSPRDVVLFFVSDEEETNEKGIKFIVEKGLIEKDDLVLVPDHGEPEGRLIDITEKAIMWIKVTVRGEQCHASLPLNGKNAFRASMIFGSRVDTLLHERFSAQDPNFDHHFSSFEPTRREPRQTGINVLPGEDIFYFDCRLLPVHSSREVLEVMNNVARTVEEETGTTIFLEPVLEEITENPTTDEAPIVKMLSDAIYQVHGKAAVTGGISGGTCAAILRNAGYKVAVWETIENQAHSPNESLV